MNALKTAMLLGLLSAIPFIQYAGENLTGGHYDESIVYDDAWHAPLKVVPATEYIVVRLPDGASSKMLSGMTLK